MAQLGRADVSELLDVLPNAVVLCDDDLRIVGWNAAATVLYGHERGAAVGEDVLDVLFDVDDRIAAGARLRAVAPGEVWEGDQRVRRRDGVLLVSSFRLAVVGETRAWIATDGMDQGLAEQERSILLSAERAARTTAEEALGLVEAIVTSAPVGIAVFDLDLRYVRVNQAFAELSGRTPGEHLGAGAQDLIRFPSEFGADLRRVVTTGRTILERSLSIDGRPGLTRHFTVSYYPVRTTAGELVGAGATVVEVTDARAAEVERAELLRRAEAAQGRLSVLATASTALTSTMEVRELITRLSRVLAPGVADWCIIEVLADAVVEHVSVAHRDASAAQDLEQLLRGSSLALDGDGPVATALRTGQAQLLGPEVIEQALGAAVADRNRTIPPEQYPLRSSVVVPIAVRSRSFGVLILSTDGERLLDDDDLDLAVEVAHRAALALGNALAFQQEHRIAESLQRAMLPETVPVIPGLDLEVRYLAATGGASVGGDWYDVIEFDDGEVGLVIGDIVGHDLAASTTMGQVRSVLRAFACEDHRSPRDALVRLDRLFDVLRLEEATSVFGVVDRERRSFRWSNAGHPAPALLRDGEVTLLEDGLGVMLGVTGGSGGREASIDLLPGDVLVLYTDGLIERRDHSLDAGFDRLARALATLDRRSGEALCDQILAAVLPPDAQRFDDIAILVVEVDAEEDNKRHRLYLEPKLESVAVARGFIAGLLGGAGWDEVVDSATLLVSELATNALNHGRGPITLQARFVEDDLVEISLQDGDSAVPTVRRPDDSSEHGRGLLLVEALAESWGIRAIPGGKQVWATLRR